MDRIKGVTLSIYTENYNDLLRQYQDPEGWAITDAGLNGDEDGYYFGVEARGIGGGRQINLTLTRAALQGMLDTIVDRFDRGTYGSNATFEFQQPATNTANTSCCVDGCSCQQSG